MSVAKRTMRKISHDVVSLRNPSSEQDGQDVQDGQDKEKTSTSMTTFARLQSAPTGMARAR